MLIKTRGEGMVGVTYPNEVLRDSQSQFLLPTSFSERKRTFLHDLASPSDKTKYKRYAGAPIRYAGGKSLAVGLIVERIPDETKRIISPFLGGGSVEVACANELSLPVIASDIFDILTTYWKVHLGQPEALYQRLLLLQWMNLGMSKNALRSTGKENFS